MSSFPPPGWYPDNADRHRLRWWDGGAWTSILARAEEPRRPWVRQKKCRRWLALCIVAAATVVSYALWLGSNENYKIGADGYEHGPYQPWQVIGFVSVMALVVAIVGSQLLVLDTAVVVSIALTVTFAAYSAPEDRQGYGEWAR